MLIAKGGRIYPFICNWFPFIISLPEAQKYRQCICSGVGVRMRVRVTEGWLYAGSIHRKGFRCLIHKKEGNIIFHQKIRQKSQEPREKTWSILFTWYHFLNPSVDIKRGKWNFEGESQTRVDRTWVKEGRWKSRREKEVRRRMKEGSKDRSGSRVVFWS